MQADLTKFERRQTRIVAVCVDDAETSLTLARELGLEFPIVIDREFRLTKAYGVFDATNEIAWPALFVIDGDGQVRWHWVAEDYERRPATSELLDALDQVQQAR